MSLLPTASASSVRGTSPSPGPGGWNAAGDEPDMLKAKEVMAKLRYKDPGSFWNAVYTQGIPHVRYNRRMIRFPRGALDDWIRRHSA